MQPKPGLAAFMPSGKVTHPVYPTAPAARTVPRQLTNTEMRYILKKHATRNIVKIYQS